MFTQDGEMLSGWPLGLEVMNSRLRMTDQPSIISSFSSLSSSELDTVSSASFFQDHSVSLGRLIGIRPTDHKRWLYENGNVSINAALLDESKQNTAQISPRICIPLLFGIILKVIRSRRNSRR